MVKMKLVELKKTHHLMEAHKGVLMRTLMMALQRYKPDKVILEKGENIKLHVREEFIGSDKFGRRILAKGPVQIEEIKE